MGGVPDDVAITFFYLEDEAQQAVIDNALTNGQTLHQAIKNTGAKPLGAEPDRYIPEEIPILDEPTAEIDPDFVLRVVKDFAEGNY